MINHSDSHSDTVSYTVWV